LVRNASAGDSLLLSGSGNGFTAVILRGDHPLIVRTVKCTEAECEDEFYRLLLFYRDRRAADDPDKPAPLTRFMIVGEGLARDRAS